MRRDVIPVTDRTGAPQRLRSELPGPVHPEPHPLGDAQYDVEGERGLRYIGTLSRKLWANIDLNAPNSMHNGLKEAFDAARSGGESALLVPCSADSTLPGRRNMPRLCGGRDPVRRRRNKPSRRRAADRRNAPASVLQHPGQPGAWELFGDRHHSEYADQRWRHQWQSIRIGFEKQRVVPGKLHQSQPAGQHRSSGNKPRPFQLPLLANPGLAPANRRRNDAAIIRSAAISDRLLAREQTEWVRSSRIPQTAWRITRF